MDMWEMLSAMYAVQTSYEADCFHFLLSVIWLDPEVWQCDACGTVFCPEDGPMEVELARPFAEALE